MICPPLVVRTPADQNGSNSRTSYLHRALRSTRNFFAHGTRVTFGCNHRNPSEVVEELQTCLDCGAWRHVLPAFYSMPACTSRWRESELKPQAKPARATAACPPVLKRLLDEDARDAAFIKLLFAAKRLASGAMRENCYGGVSCRECGEDAEAAAQIRHARICDVGGIFAAIADLESQVSQAPLRKETAQEHGPASPAPYLAGDANDYGEPWRADNPGSGLRRIFDREETMIARTVSASPMENYDWANRIVASVNFCAGIETARLRVSVPLGKMGSRRAEGVAGLFTEKAGRL